MSNTGQSGGFAGRRAGGEKSSNFSLTCSLLSQYLKEKGGLGDLSFGMSRPLDAKAKPDPPRTMNLFPGIAAAAAAAAAAKSSPIAAAAAPSQLTQALASSAPTEEAKKKEEPKAAQMTMFYGGKVIVFDDFPADKAEELMAMATKGSFDQTTPAAFPAAAPAILPAAPAALPKPPLNSLNLPPPLKAVVSTAPCGNKPVAAVAATVATVAGAQDRPQAPVQKPPLPIGSDLPIARRNSLNRFLEKRKGRISSLAPYQVNGPDAPTSSSDTAPSKPDEKEKQKQPWFAPSSSGQPLSRSEEKRPWFGSAAAPSKPEEKQHEWLGLGPMTPIEVPESPERQRR